MPDVVIPFDDTVANIPLGWARDTDFDGKYFKVSTSDLGGFGGAATHSHVSPVHGHSYASNNHTHPMSITNTGNVQKTNARHQDNPDHDIAPETHSHTTTASGTPISLSCSTTAATIGSADNEYSRYELIFIRGSIHKPLPNNGIVMRDTTASRPKASHFDDLDGKYPKGAAAGVDAGASYSVTTHNHSQSHSHTLVHDHANVNSGNVSNGLLGTNLLNQGLVGNHSHTMYFANANITVNNSTNVPAATADLSYKEMHFWKATEQNRFRVGDIVISTDAAVPIGWVDLGLNDVYIKGKSEGGSLTTGGSNTHGHSNIYHYHPGQSHSHTYTSSSASGNYERHDGGSENMKGTHSHSGTTSAATDSNTGYANVSVNDANHEPEYIKVKLIKKTKDIKGGSLYSLI